MCRGRGSVQISVGVHMHTHTHIITARLLNTCYHSQPPQQRGHGNVTYFRDPHKTFGNRIQTHGQDITAVQSLNNEKVLVFYLSHCYLSLASESHEIYSKKGK